VVYALVPDGTGAAKVAQRCCFAPLDVGAGIDLDPETSLRSDFEQQKT
jgi:hypothetical protein